MVVMIISCKRPPNAGCVQPRLIPDIGGEKLSNRAIEVALRGRRDWGVSLLGRCHGSMCAVAPVAFRLDAQGKCLFEACCRNRKPTD